MDGGGTVTSPALGNDYDESAYEGARLERLVNDIMRLARRDEADLPVYFATLSDGRLIVTVGSEEAAEAVRGIAKEAEVVIE